ncbi:hypothetical protein QBC39DRAFT_397193 [Podospora conica]|nr:hypothetical protein QBC39DRAFT_397193 [Schizothecium conicum]
MAIEVSLDAVPKPVKKIEGSVAVAGDKDTWIWHKDFDNDLVGIPGLTESARQEVLTAAWEYARITVPHYTNWERFSCWVRFLIIGILAEYEGSVLDIAMSDKQLGYDVEELLNTMLRDRPGAEEMKREYRAFLLVTADKCSDRRDSELFRRYVDHLARDPKAWFRARDCDALARFTIAAALCSNDVDDVWFTDDQLEILAEIGVTLYDAVAFFKHRSEGETNNTFGYLDPKHRAAAYKRAREVLWAFDAAWGSDTKKLIAINFIRPFGGSLHMTMRRYRYVEDGMIIGKEEDEATVDQTRQHYKLWHRVDLRDDYDPQEERYRQVIADKARLLYPGLAEALEKEDETDRCGKCVFRKIYGTTKIAEFGGVKLCEGCEDKYCQFAETLPSRAAAAFPELLTHSQLRLKY